MIQAPEIYSLSKFTASNTLLLAIVIMVYIRSPDLLILHNYNSVPLWPTSPHFPHLLAPGNLCSALCFCALKVFIFYTYVRLCILIFFCVWLISSILPPSGFIHCCKQQGLKGGQPLKTASESGICCNRHGQIEVNTSKIHPEMLRPCSYSILS